MEKEKIAELCGAIVGDGWIENREKGFFIAGDPNEDRDYYDNHLVSLISEILNEDLKTKEFPYWKVYGVSVYKKEKIKKLLSFGLSKGKKVYSAYVPDWIFESKNRKIFFAFLRGLFDADGSLFFGKDYTKYANKFNSMYHTKARLRIATVSERLVDQIHILSERFGLKNVKRSRKIKSNTLRNNSDFFIFEINRIDMIKIFFEEIRPANPKHTTKYSIWKKFGFCPPKTSIFQRKEILKNNINPYNLYMQR